MLQVFRGRQSSKEFVKAFFVEPPISKLDSDTLQLHPSQFHFFKDVPAHRDAVHDQSRRGPVQHDHEEQIIGVDTKNRVVIPIFADTECQARLDCVFREVFQFGSFFFVVIAEFDVDVPMAGRCLDHVPEAGRHEADLAKKRRGRKEGENSEEKLLRNVGQRTNERPAFNSHLKSKLYTLRKNQKCLQ